MRYFNIWYISYILIWSSQSTFGSLERMDCQLTYLVFIELDIYNKVLGIIMKSHL